LLQACPSFWEPPWQTCGACWHPLLSAKSLISAGDCHWLWWVINQCFGQHRCTYVHIPLVWRISGVTVFLSEPQETHPISSKLRSCLPCHLIFRLVLLEVSLWMLARATLYMPRGLYSPWTSVDVYYPLALAS
jgi:hypothetical protein